MEIGRKQKFIDLLNEGKSFQDIGNKFNISKQRVYQIVYKKQSNSKTKRFYIPKLVRSLIYKRDSNSCVYCGKKTNLTLNHIVPKIAGGNDESDNLETTCLKCNSKVFSELIKIAIIFYFKNNIIRKRPKIEITTKDEKMRLLASKLGKIGGNATFKKYGRKHFKNLSVHK